VLFDPSGSLVASYRKVHLFGFDGLEAATLSGGDDLVVVDTPLGPTGLATCYDLRFPELFRGLVDRGATAVLLTSGWPQARIGHWQVLAQARAIENQCWVAGCNETGTHAGVELGGSSAVVDPWGTVIATAASAEAVVFADIDPNLPETVRDGFPVLRDRKL
ncbi:MAG: nitrilase-related carbon-nitrogen hydrolase, partial [Candidatus Nanopelagicales bacterium]